MDACPRRASRRAYICFLYILLCSFLYPHVHTLKTLTHADPLSPPFSSQPKENHCEPSENHHYCRLTNAAIYMKRSRLPSTFAASLTLSPLMLSARLKLQTIDTGRYTPPPLPPSPLTRQSILSHHPSTSRQGKKKKSATKKPSRSR